MQTQTKPQGEAKSLTNSSRPKGASGASYKEIAKIRFINPVSIPNGGVLNDPNLSITIPINTFRVLVTPAIAEYWLTLNQGNRNMKPRNLAQIVQDMRTGQWSEDPVDYIGFDEQGVLRNGQHTLQGIVITGKSFWLEVKINMSKRAIAVMDTGAKRTSADLLFIEGMKFPIQKAAAAKFVLLFKSGRYSDAAEGSVRQRDKDLTVTNNSVLRFVKQHPEMEEIIKDFQNYLNKGWRGLSSSEMTALYMIFSEKNVNQAEDFFEKLVQGTGLGLTSPIYHLRERLLANRNARKKMGKREKIALIVLAWNSYRSNERVKFLSFNDKMEFPKVK